MRIKLFVITLVTLLFTASCSAALSTPTPDLEATLEIRLQQTLTAQPTGTSPPSPTPGNSPSPSPPPTSRPTDPPHSAAQPSQIPTVTEGPPPLSTSSDDRGWTQITSRVDPYSVAIPPHWIFLNLYATDHRETLSRAAEEAPEITNVYSVETLQNMSSAGIKFLAVDSRQISLTSGIPTNVNILITELPTEVRLEDYMTISETRLKDLFGADLTIKQTVTTLAEMDAGKVIYSAPMNNYRGEEQEVVFTQYHMFDGKTLIALTFAVSKDAYQANAGVFESIAQSFEYGE